MLLAESTRLLSRTTPSKAPRAPEETRTEHNTTQPTHANQINFKRMIRERDSRPTLFSCCKAFPTHCPQAKSPCVLRRPTPTNPEHTSDAATRNNSDRHTHRPSRHTCSLAAGTKRGTETRKAFLAPEHRCVMEFQWLRSNTGSELYNPTQNFTLARDQDSGLQ